MSLPYAGREYFKWTPDANSVLTAYQYKASGAFTSTNWTAMNFIPGSPNILRLLVAGGGADNTDGLADLVLPSGTTNFKIRVVDTPEVIIRDGGSITVDAP